MPEYENTPAPNIGEWYLDRESEERFEVVGVDEDFGTVEVQYLNGEIAEFAEEEWSARELAHVEPPEDFTLALEPVEDGDAGYDADSVEPPRQRSTPGFETEDVLRSDEEGSRDEVVEGSEPEEE